jgi:hypothetical protein
MSVVLVFRSDDQPSSRFRTTHAPVTGVRTARPHARVACGPERMLGRLPDDV